MSYPHERYDYTGDIPMNEYRDPMRVSLRHEIPNNHTRPSLAFLSLPWTKLCREQVVLTSLG